MSNLLGRLFVWFMLVLTPFWACELTHIDAMYWVVVAGELGLIALAAVQPGRSASAAGGAARGGWPVAWTVIGIAALNCILNLIWPFRW